MSDNIFACDTDRELELGFVCTSNLFKHIVGCTQRASVSASGRKIVFYGRRNSSFILQVSICQIGDISRLLVEVGSKNVERTL